MKYIGLFISIAIWGLLHSALAAQKTKIHFNRYIGDKYSKYYRLFYNFFSIITFLPIIVIGMMKPEIIFYAITFPWLILILLIEGILLILLIIGILQTGVWKFIGITQLVRPESSFSSQLVTRGMYQYVRHPLYTIGILMIWMFPFMTMTVFIMNISLTIYILVGSYFEEKKLLSEFGSEYIDYINRTPKFIPFIK